MKFTIYTLGCKVNQYESEYIINKLIKKGWEYVKNFEDRLDLVIINSCTVTDEAKRQSYQIFRKFKRIHPEAKILFTGCVVDEDKSDISDFTVSNFYKYRIPEILEENEKISLLQDIFNENEFRFLDVENFYNTTRAFLKIQDGCNNYCSYCKIIYVRGKPRSLDEKIVLSKLIEYSEKFKEVVLCGINIQLYGIDFGKKDGLYELLIKVEEELSKKNIKDFRIRLTSLRPDKIDKKFIKLISESKYFCPHFHLSIQNFNNDVLKLMGRNYSYEKIKEVVGLIRNYIPLANIGADIITGFVNETEDRFYDNLKKMKEIDINYFHIFPFSKKRGTKIYSYEEKISKEEKKRRVNILKKLAQKKRMDFLKKNLNIKHRILIERKEKDIWKGYSDNYILFGIKIDSDQLKNKFINVIGEKIIGNMILGR